MKVHGVIKNLTHDKSLIDNEAIEGFKASSMKN